MKETREAINSDSTKYGITIDYRKFDDVPLIAGYQLIAAGLHICQGSADEHAILVY
ncbi:hypothetical protein [Pectobacterium sp. F1-1]|uniref:hypothetical protein n=1 Tax=Pectobacterium sp. F1-1 TaxID=2949614 RepID=UPI0021D7C040|nr:hypothetical protein [Pectobacterium sp. F1-1]